MHQVLLDRRDGAQHPLVVAGQEADEGDVEQARVDLAGVVVLGEGVPRGVVPALEHLRAAPRSRSVRQRSTSPSRPCCSTAFTARSKATQTITREWVKCRSGPRISQMPLSGWSQCVASSSTSTRCSAQLCGVLLEAGVARVLEGDHHLAEHVGLALVDGAVADPDRAGAGVPGQVVELALGQPAPTVHAVHDLQVLRVPGHRAQQPVAPAEGLVGVAGRQQRLEGERGVAQPAVAVVPVAFAAELLGQRRGGRRHDAAGLRVRHHPQGEQAAAHEVGVREVRGAGEGPALVVDPGGLDAVLGGHRLGELVPGAHPRGGEGHGLAGGAGRTRRRGGRRRRGGAGGRAA